MNKLVFISQNYENDGENFGLSNLELSDFEVKKYFFTSRQDVRTFFEKKVEEIKNFAPDLLFIPTIFKEDFALEYYGVQMLLYFIFELEEFRKIPLVLLGYETVENFIKHSKFANILKLPNVFYIDYSFKSITDFLEFSKKLSIKYESKSYLEKIKELKIKPPSEYASHHNIDNIWTLYRWCGFLDCSDDVKEEIHKKVSNLYLSWLNAIEPIKRNDEYFSNITHDTRKRKFLVVEDFELWGKFYGKLIKGELKFISDVKKIDETLKVFIPDVAIVDLRLTAKDNSEKTETKNLSGFKIVKQIKKINQGIQIIVVTASNKSWSYEALKQIGADFYVVKSREFATENFEKLIESIKFSIERNYLKDFFTKIQELKNNKYTKLKQYAQQKNINVNLEELKEEINKQLDIAYTLLYFAANESEKNEKYTFAYLSFFQIFEILKNSLHLKKKNRESIAKPLVRFIKELGNHSINADDNISENINKRRNDFIHINNSPKSNNYEYIFMKNGFEEILIFFYKEVFPYFR